MSSAGPRSSGWPKSMRGIAWCESTQSAPAAEPSSCGGLQGRCWGVAWRSPSIAPRSGPARRLMATIRATHPVVAEPASLRGRSRPAVGRRFDLGRQPPRRGGSSSNSTSVGSSDRPPTTGMPSGSSSTGTATIPCRAHGSVALTLHAREPQTGSYTSPCFPRMSPNPPPREIYRSDST
jgi:hypothetical protein